MYGVGWRQRRLDHKDQFGPGFPAIDDRRGELGLTGHVVDGGHDGGRAVRFHLHPRPGLDPGKQSLGNEKTRLQVLGWE